MLECETIQTIVLITLVCFYISLEAKHFDCGSEFTLVMTFKFSRTISVEIEMAHDAGTRVKTDLQYNRLLNLCEI